MNDSHRQYFENRVLTASPAKLQWMLIDSALKAVRAAEQLLVAGQPLRANAELAHAEAILSEIVGAMRKEVSPEVVSKCAGVYAFILRCLTDAHLSGEVQPVRDASRVLAVELETWRLVCEQSEAELESTTSSESPRSSAVPPAHLFSAPSTAGADAYQGGFSLDA